MLDKGLYFWILLLGRTLAGFVVGAALAMLGGWLARIFNALIGYPWNLEVHSHIYFVGIGIGAGLGAYIGWVNFSLHRHFIAVSLLLVVLGGVAGVYTGYIYAQNIDPGIWGYRATVVNMIHTGAAIGAIAVSTAIGLLNEVRSGGR